MPTTSYSSARLSQFSRRATRAAAAAAAVEESQQRKEEENGGGIMRPHQDPKKMSNGPMKKEKVVRYRECRKNHAASVGGYAVDGCLEFMAAGEEGTSAALRCAACSCHRSFHKREVEREVLCDCSSNSTSPRS